MVHYEIYWEKIDEINVKTKNPEFLDWKWIDTIQNYLMLLLDFKVEYL